MTNYENYNFADIIKFILSHEISEEYKQKKQRLFNKHRLSDFDGRQSILFFDSVADYENFISKFRFQKYVTEIYRNQDEICLLLDPGFFLWIYILL